MASADKQAARNRKILVAKAQGEEAKAIAARFDLSPTRVRQILAAGAAVLTEDDGPDPVQAAFERRTQYEDIYERALSLFEGIPDSNPAPKAGALRLRLAALDRLATWDQTIGILPERLGWVFQEVGARSFVDKVLQSLEAAGIPAETVDKVLRSVTETDQERDTPIELAPPGE